MSEQESNPEAGGDAKEVGNRMMRWWPGSPWPPWWCWSSSCAPWRCPPWASSESIRLLGKEGWTMGDWAMTLCIRWWIESYVDAKRMHDRVHRTLEKTLDAAGIEMPYPTQTLRFQSNSGVNDDRSE